MRPGQVSLWRPVRSFFWFKNIIFFFFWLRSKRFSHHPCKFDIMVLYGNCGTNLFHPSGPWFCRKLWENVLRSWLFVRNPAQFFSRYPLFTFFSIFFKKKIGTFYCIWSPAKLDKLGTNKKHVSGSIPTAGHWAERLAAGKTSLRGEQKPGHWWHSAVGSKPWQTLRKG